MMRGLRCFWQWFRKTPRSQQMEPEELPPPARAIAEEQAELVRELQQVGVPVDTQTALILRRYGVLVVPGEDSFEERRRKA